MPVGVVVVAAHWRMVDVDLGAVYYRLKMTWLLHHFLYWKSCSILRCRRGIVVAVVVVEAAWFNQGQRSDDFHFFKHGHLKILTIFML